MKSSWSTHNRFFVRPDKILLNQNQVFLFLHPQMLDGWKYWMSDLNIEMWYDRWLIISCDLCQVWGDIRPCQAMPGLSPGKTLTPEVRRLWVLTPGREELSVGPGLFYVSCPRQHWALREQWPDNTGKCSQKMYCQQTSCSHCLQCDRFLWHFADIDTSDIIS